MVILGIDPGLAHTGWGIVETRGSECRARAYGCITTTADEPIDMRLEESITRLLRLQISFHQKLFLLRAFTLDKNVKSAIPTAHARGAAIVACSKAGLTVGEYTPMQIKQAVVWYRSC